MLTIAVSLIVLNAEARRDQRREGKQQSRIAHGVKSDELTVREAKKLRKGQKKIDRMQEKFKEDGVVDAQEKLRLEKAQDRQSAKIYKLKHNEQQRGDGKGTPVTPGPVEPQPVPESSTGGAANQ